MGTQALGHVRRHWPLYGAVLAYWLSVLVLLGESAGRNDGHLIYPLDDTYIHMAIGKNAALHHVWGVTKYGFTSSTSSPLWTALLAGSYAAFGVYEITPLLLNLLFGTWLVVVLYGVLSRPFRSAFAVAGGLLLTVLAVPLPTLTILGMEHVLHALLSLALIDRALRGFRETTGISRPPAPTLFLATLAALVTATRYEGLFLVFLLCLLFLAQRRALQAVVVGAAALLPVSGYGLWSQAHGWFLLPNSVLLKGHRPGASLGDLFDLISLGTARLLIRGDVLALLLASVLALLTLRRSLKSGGNDFARRANLLFAGTAFLHVLFAAIDDFYRYEAYLVLLGLVVLGMSMPALRDSLRVRGLTQALPHALSALLLVAIGTTLGQRAWGALRDTPLASANIYGQQYQMGTFVRLHHPGATVALNDIGAVAYLADVRIVDLWGLGSIEPAAFRLRGTYGTADIADIAVSNRAQMALVYTDWFDRFGGLPPAWIEAGHWTIPDNIVAGDDTVTFYAMDASTHSHLVDSLREFAPDLPSGIVQGGAYVQAAVADGFRDHCCGAGRSNR